ncbi:UNVERIFIED_CONTAM: hypothetical protein HDU68_009298 [Siphonaria sp. JEL0065]|nr:hypothetical protein HDU68_009298 [Siphonaria sp. JEL0065]
MENTPVEKTLDTALQHARNAQRFDGSGETLLALNSYRRSLLLLDLVLGASDMASVHGHRDDAGRDPLERDARTRLVGLRSRYVVRVEELLATLPANARAVYSGQSFVHPPQLESPGSVAGSLSLVPEHTYIEAADSQYAAMFAAVLADDSRVPPDARIAPPEALISNNSNNNSNSNNTLASIAQRLRIAARALDKRGAFVSPRLAVPLYVLLLIPLIPLKPFLLFYFCRQVANNSPPGLRLVAIEQKMATLEQLYALFSDFGSSPVSPQSLPDLVARTKETVDQILTSPTLALSKKLAGEISNPFDEKQGAGGVTKMFKNMFVAAGTGGAVVQTIPRGDKVADLASYIEVVLRCTNAISPALDSWNAVLTQNPRLTSNDGLMQDIEFIAKFFDGVVLAFVVRDLERLIERFLRKVTAAAIAS